ncbi:hypothetical protein JCM3765_007609 [Sporobolomyces pararoseus]
MNPSNSAANLPDELILQIFRNKHLSPCDLARCSLLSRRFVDSARKWLYETVNLGIFHGSAHHEEGQEPIFPDPEFTLASWKLMRTLTDSPEIASYVREIVLGGGITPQEPRLTIKTTARLALENILRLTPKTKKLKFGRSWSFGLNELEIIRNYQNLEELSVLVLREEAIDILGEHLPHLTFLQAVQVAPRPASEKRFKSLRTFETSCPHPEILPSFIIPSCTTLRKLRLPLQTAALVDFSQLPALHTFILQLHDPSGVTARTPRFVAAGESKAFWTALARSPSLRTLVLDSPRHSDHFEAALFGTSDGRRSGTGSGGPTESIPSLRTLEFQDDFLLDRANSLLASPLSKTLIRLVVPAAPINPEDSSFHAGQVRAVVGMCEAKGIEVVLIDRGAW